MPQTPAPVTPPIPVLPAGTPVPVSHPLATGRVFDISSVETAIDHAIASLPADHNWGVILHGEAHEGGEAFAVIAVVKRTGPLQFEVHASAGTKQSWEVGTNLIISGK